LDRLARRQLGRLLDQPMNRSCITSRSATTVHNPNTKGFDHFFGFVSHADARHYYPEFLWRDGKKVPYPGNHVREGDTYSGDELDVRAGPTSRPIVRGDGRAAPKKLVAELGIERVTPHDLRRTCLTTITRLGFGRDAMDRIANHKTRAVTDVYDRHGYADEDKQIMAAVARQVLSLVEESGPTNVVALRYRRDRACPWSFPYIRETDPPAGTPGSPVQKGQTASRSRRSVSDEGRRRGDEGDRSTIKLSVHGGSRNPQSTASQQRVQPARVLRSM